mgnify:CR=1 FL=1
MFLMQITGGTWVIVLSLCLLFAAGCAYFLFGSAGVLAKFKLKHPDSKKAIDEWNSLLPQNQGKCFTALQAATWRKTWDELLKAVSNLSQKIEPNSESCTATIRQLFSLCIKANSESVRAKANEDWIASRIDNYKKKYPDFEKLLADWNSLLPNKQGKYFTNQQAGTWGTIWELHLKAAVELSKKIEPYTESCPETIQQLFSLCTKADSEWERTDANEVWVASQLEKYSEWFDSIENYPLSDEQRIAAVRDDDRNMVVAGAILAPGQQIDWLRTPKKPP